MNRFHLAIEAGDLKTAVDFYVNVLGCTKHNSEFKLWVMQRLKKKNNQNVLKIL